MAKARPVVHARYLSWAGRACSLANRAAGEVVMHRWSLDLYLFEWAVEMGLIVKPGKTNQPLSVYVAGAFERDPEAVKAEARRYWRRKVKQLE